MMEVLRLQACACGLRWVREGHPVRARQAPDCAAVLCFWSWWGWACWTPLLLYRLVACLLLSQAYQAAGGFSSMLSLILSALRCREFKIPTCW